MSPTHTHTHTTCKICPSIGPSVGQSVRLAFFYIAEIGKSDKSKPANLSILTESDKSLSAIQS